jgi:hypothetical protein
MKNLRSALDFFANYSPDQIAKVQADPSSLAQAVQAYKDEVGKIIALQASILQKYPVSEEIESNSNAPSALLSLGASDTDVTASMLVLGSSLDDLKAGDTIGFRCIPLYCYLPKDGAGSVFFITIPELIQKS